MEVRPDPTTTPHSTQHRPSPQRPDPTHENDPTQPHSTQHRPSPQRPDPTRPQLDTETTRPNPIRPNTDPPPRGPTQTDHNSTRRRPDPTRSDPIISCIYCLGSTPRFHALWVECIHAYHVCIVWGLHSVQHPCLELFRLTISLFLSHLIVEEEEL